MYHPSTEKHAPKEAGVKQYSMSHYDNVHGDKAAEMKRSVRSVQKKSIYFQKG